MWCAGVDRLSVGALGCLWLASGALMHRDPTFEQAHANLEREKRRLAALPQLIVQKQRRIRVLLKRVKGRR